MNYRQTEASLDPIPVRISLNSNGIVSKPLEHHSDSFVEQIQGLSYAGEEVQIRTVYVCSFCDKTLDPITDTLGPCPFCFGGEYITYLKR